MQLLRFYSKDLFIISQAPATLSAASPLRTCSARSSLLLDTPLVALNSLHESSVDVVIDGVGSRRVYDASRRVLHFGGQFISVVESPKGEAETGGDWKVGMRSLRRAFLKKDNKAISVCGTSLSLSRCAAPIMLTYIHVEPQYWSVTSDRKLTRDSLDVLRDAIEASGAQPLVDEVLTLDDASKAFVGDVDNEEKGITVIRVFE